MRKATDIPWSYSQLSMYEACPLHWKFAYLEQRPRSAPGAAAQRGIDIHLECEIFLQKPRAKKVPDTLGPLGPRLLEAKKRGARAETEVFLADDWTPTKKGRHWGVVKVDIHWVEAYGQPTPMLAVVDLKSGRPRPTFEDQGRIYLGGLLPLYPEAQRFYAEQWYTDGTVLPRRRTVFNRRQVEGIQREVTLRVERMHADREHPAKPSEAACRWCDFAKSRGGPCRYG